MRHNYPKLTSFEPEPEEKRLKSDKSIYSKP